MSVSKRDAVVHRAGETPARRGYPFAGRRHRCACDALDAYLADWEASHGSVAAPKRSDVGDPMVTRIVSVLWDVIQARMLPTDEAMRCLKLSNQTMLEAVGRTPSTSRCEHYLGRGAGDDGVVSVGSMSTETLLSLDPFAFCVNCVYARPRAAGEGNGRK